jgi:hypothetical protein
VIDLWDIRGDAYTPHFFCPLCVSEVLHWTTRAILNLEDLLEVIKAPAVKYATIPNRNRICDKFTRRTTTTVQFADIHGAPGS